MLETRKGMVLPVVVLFALLMGAFIATMSPMGRSTRTRIQNLNKNQGCFFVAQGAYAKLMAEIHRVSWQNRSFATAPYREIGQPILNGDYDLHVENTPGAPDFHMDIYIRSRFSERTQLYFWRVLYRSDLLDISNRHLIIHHAKIRDDEFPATDGREFAAKIDKLLAIRNNNEETGNDLSRKIRTKTNIQDILNIIKSPDPDATNTDEFKTRVAQVNTPVIQIPPIDFPSANSEEADTVLVPTPPPDPSNPENPSLPAARPPSAIPPAATQYDPTDSLSGAESRDSNFDAYVDEVTRKYIELMETIPVGTYQDNPIVFQEMSKLATLVDVIEGVARGAHDAFDPLSKLAELAGATQSVHSKSIYETALADFSERADSVEQIYLECMNLIGSIGRNLSTRKLTDPLKPLPPPLPGDDPAN